MYLFLCEKLNKNDTRLPSTLNWINKIKLRLNFKKSYLTTL